MDNWRLKYERLITPVFRTYWRFSRSATLGVRGVATNEAGHVMLVKHTYLRGWHLPGGGVERGENAPYAISREMEEEAGIEPTDPPPRSLRSTQTTQTSPAITSVSSASAPGSPVSHAPTKKSPSAASLIRPIRRKEPRLQRCAASPRCSKARR